MIIVQTIVNPGTLVVQLLCSIDIQGVVACVFMTSGFGCVVALDVALFGVFAIYVQFTVSITNHGVCADIKML